MRFFFSSRRRHTRCALVTGVQTCALPICPQPTLMISPCSSHALRNWLPQRYAEVADHAVARHGMRIALIGGGSGIEHEMGDAILAHMQQIGRASCRERVCQYV